MTWTLPSHITSPLYIQHSPVRHAGLISYAIFLGSATQLQIPVGLHLTDKKSFPRPQQRHLPAVRMAAITVVLLRAALAAVPCQRSSWLSAVPGGILRAPPTHRTAASCNHGWQGPLPPKEAGGSLASITKTSEPKVEQLPNQVLVWLTGSQGSGIRLLYLFQSLYAFLSSFASLSVRETFSASLITSLCAEDETRSDWALKTDWRTGQGWVGHGRRQSHH